MLLNELLIEMYLNSSPEQKTLQVRYTTAIRSIATKHGHMLPTRVTLCRHVQTAGGAD